MLNLSKLFSKKSSSTSPPFEESFQPQEGHADLRRYVSNLASGNPPGLLSPFALLIYGGSPDIGGTLQDLWDKTHEDEDSIEADTDANGPFAATSSPTSRQALVLTEDDISFPVIGDGSTQFCSKGKDLWDSCASEEKTALGSCFVATAAWKAELVERSSLNLVETESPVWRHLMDCSEEECTRTREACGNATFTKHTYYSWQQGCLNPDVRLHGHHRFGWKCNEPSHNGPYSFEAAREVKDWLGESVKPRGNTTAAWRTMRNGVRGLRQHVMNHDRKHGTGCLTSIGATSGNATVGKLETGVTAIVLEEESGTEEHRLSTVSSTVLNHDGDDSRPLAVHREVATETTGNCGD